jgi:polysaccharide biosynthesis/export protein
MRLSDAIGYASVETRRLCLALALTAALGCLYTASAQDVSPQTAVQGGSNSSSMATASSGVPIGDSLIYPEDVLNVYVYDVPELSRDYPVNSAGTITIPLLPKPVQAAGLSPEELARSLEESFRQSGRLSHAQITVFVQRSRRSIVTVEGAVRNPQAVPVVGPTPLIAVITQCGGRSDDAGNSLTVTRGEIAMQQLEQEGEHPAAVSKVYFKELLNPNDKGSKVKVWPGDRVSVERAGIFYVLGQVSRPGGYNLRSADEQLSVLQAIALAGDVTPIAKSDKAMIIRKDKKAADGREEIALNLKSIIQGTSPDKMLKADDILFIPVSGGKKAMRTMGNIGTSIAAGAGSALVYARY